jgi:hypothetical protein
VWRMLTFLGQSSKIRAATRKAFSRLQSTWRLGDRLPISIKLVMTVSTSSQDWEIAAQAKTVLWILVTGTIDQARSIIRLMR